MRRKLTFQAHGRKAVLIKRPEERMRHVLMEALIWALYLPDYPRLRIEVAIGAHFKPDVVAVGEDEMPHFRGEAGKVSIRKIRKLVKVYRQTHLVFAKWDVNLAHLDPFYRSAAARITRTAPVDLISLPPDSAERFVDGQNSIALSLSDVTHRRYGA